MLYFLTIVLDGMPWIGHHLAQFEQLSKPWHWVIAEGRADGILDTAWCKRLAGRLSNDGTTEYLDDLSYHPTQAPRGPRDENRSHSAKSTDTSHQPNNQLSCLNESLILELIP